MVKRRRMTRCSLRASRAQRSCMCLNNDCLFTGMRNLKLLKCVRMWELQSLGSPQCVSVRIDTDTTLIASQFSITEYDPRTGQVKHLY